MLHEQLQQRDGMQALLAAGHVHPRRLVILHDLVQRKPVIPAPLGPLVELLVRDENGTVVKIGQTLALAGGDLGGGVAAPSSGTADSVALPELAPGRERHVRLHHGALLLEAGAVVDVDRAGHAALSLTTPAHVLVVRIVRELSAAALEHDSVVVFVRFARENQVLFVAGAVIQAVY